MSEITLEQARKMSTKKVQAEIKIENTTWNTNLEDEIFSDDRKVTIPNMKDLKEELTKKPSKVEKKSVLGRNEPQTKKNSTFDLEDEIFNDEPKEPPKKEEPKRNVVIPPLKVTKEEKVPPLNLKKEEPKKEEPKKKKDSFDLEDEIFNDEPEEKKEEPKIIPPLKKEEPKTIPLKKEEPKKETKKQDLEDEIFGDLPSPQKETPKKEEVKIPTLNLKPKEEKITIETEPKKKQDLEDEIFGDDEKTPKKEPEKKPIVIPKLDLQPEPQPTTPKKEEQTSEKNLTKSEKSFTSPKRGKSILNSILSTPKPKEQSQPKLPNTKENDLILKHMTKEEAEEVRRVRSKSQKRQSVALQKKKKTLDDFDGSEYIRATIKEGYLIKPNSDMTKAYKRYCVAEKLEGRILFTIWKSKKYVNNGDPIQKIIIDQEVQREAVLFKTVKKSQSYDSGKEFHDCIVIYYGKTKEPIRLWTRDDFEVKEWELTLKCMLYFDEDDEDDESDSDDDEKTKEEKRKRRMKRANEKKEKVKEKRKKMGCFGRIYEFVFNK